MKQDLPQVKPFLHWAGGKSQLLSSILPQVPETFNDYFEPFLGGGAVFFALHSNNMLQHKVTLSDINPEIINAYTVIRDNPDELMESLELKKQNHSKDHYYQVRSLSVQDLSAIEQASRFIYLNKTCFNGLYRVNSKGQFNVPMGTYRNPGIYDRNNILAISRSLKHVNLKLNTFLSVLETASAGDFIYFDPPYYPVSETASFTAYTKDRFGPEDQIQLCEAFKELDKRGAKVMLSNSWCDFILDLYKDFNCIEVFARRAINSNAKKRGAVSEVLVMNY